MASEPGGWAAAAVRLFAGFAGFGAGSVNLAVSSSLIAGPAGSGPPWQTAAGLLSGAWGAALVLWSVVSLHRGRTAGPAWSPALLVVAAGSHAAAIALSRGQSSSLNLSHFAALLLTLMIIASLAWLNRQRMHGNDDGVPATAARPGRLLLAAFAGAVLVAGIATPGLAASAAGRYAVPHGQHGDPGLLNGHHQR